MNPTPKNVQEPKKDPQLGQKEKQPGQQQMQGGEGQQYGEGSYSGARQYNEGVKEHLAHNDVEQEARDAAPRTDVEAKEMEQAERYARGKSRGEGQPPDGNAADESRRDASPDDGK